MNAVFPAPVAGRMVINHRIAICVFGALAQLVPERIPASYYAISYVYALSTVDPEQRRRVYFDIEVGGWGGHAGGDGASALSCGLHNDTNAPVEMVEAKYLVTFQRYGLIPDSGGAGKNRGGLGLVREWRLDSGEGLLSTMFERFRFPPRGIAGGGPGSLSRTTLSRADGTTVLLRSKVSGIRIAQGDVVTVETSGGGGYGEAFGGEADHLAQERRIRALLQQRAKGDLVIGHRGGPRVRVASRSPTLPSNIAMTTDRLVSAAAYGDSYDKPINGVLHHHRGHDRVGQHSPDPQRRSPKSEIRHHDSPSRALSTRSVPLARCSAFFMLCFDRTGRAAGIRFC